MSEEPVHFVICVKCRKQFQLGDLYVEVRSFGDPDVTVYWMHMQCPPIDPSVDPVEIGAEALMKAFPTLRDDFTLSFDARGRHDMKLGGEILYAGMTSNNCARWTRRCRWW